MSIINIIPSKRGKIQADSFYVFKEDDLKLNPNDPQIPYTRNLKNLTASWGQLKLFLSVIELLNYYYSPQKYPNLHLIYAGAAPGNNIELLARMYPEITWILYDPREIVAKGSNIHIYQQFFEDKDASHWFNEGRRNNIPIAFYSDIRTVDYREQSDEETEIQVEKDMENQSRWYSIIQPVFAMLKFRLRYSGKGIISNIQYANNGTIFKGIYSPPSSSETRLVPYGYDNIPYDIIKYENQMAFHNQVTRKMNFLIPNLENTIAQFPFNSEFTNTYDSVAEIIILLQYLQTRGGLETATLDNAYNIHKMFINKIGEGRDKETWITVQRLINEPLLIKRKFLKKGTNVETYKLTDNNLIDFLNLWYQYKVSKLLLQKLQELTESTKGMEKQQKFQLMGILEKWLVEIMDCPECVTTDQWQNYYQFFHSTGDIEQALMKYLHFDLKNISAKELNLSSVLRQLKNIIVKVGPTQFHKMVTILNIPEKYNYSKNSLGTDANGNMILVGIYTDLFQILDGETSLTIYRNSNIDELFSKNPIGTIFSLVKYSGLMTGMNQLSFTDNVMRELKQFGVVNEAFSSPFNSRSICTADDMRFCSLYDNTDLISNYVGDFFRINFNNFGGGWLVFPPFVDKVIDKTINHIARNYKLMKLTVLVVPEGSYIENLKQYFPYSVISKDTIDLVLFSGRKIKNPINLYVFVISEDINNPNNMNIVTGIINTIQNISMSARIVVKEQVPVVVEFPYKRTFLDRDKVWEQILTTDMSTLIKLPDDNSWKSIPDEYNFFVTPDGNKIKLGITTAENDYEFNSFSDLFAEEARMQSCLRGQIDPYTFYQTHYEEILKEATERLNVNRNILREITSESSIVNVRETDANINSRGINYYLREVLYEKSKHLECSVFKISVAKTIFKHFGVNTVLDPSAGWTDRLIAAAVSDVKLYHGVDPNLNLRDAFNNVINFLREQQSKDKLSKEIDLNNYGLFFDDFLILEGFPDNYYDMVFTAPPVYDYEIYVQNLSDPKQSIFQKRDVDSWLKEFLFPYLEKAWKKLRIDGRMLIAINDTNTEKFINKMLNFVNNELRGNYMGVISMINFDKSDAEPIWVWQKP